VCSQLKRLWWRRVTVFISCQFRWFLDESPVGFRYSHIPTLWVISSAVFSTKIKLSSMCVLRMKVIYCDNYCGQTVSLTRTANTWLMSFLHLLKLALQCSRPHGTATVAQERLERYHVSRYTRSWQTSLNIHCINASVLLTYTQYGSFNKTSSPKSRTTRLHADVVQKRDVSLLWWSFANLDIFASSCNCLQKNWKGWGSGKKFTNGKEYHTTVYIRDSSIWWLGIVC